MPIRAATFNDLIPAAHVLEEAFQNNELFGPDFMHPYLDQHPDGLYLYFLRRIRVPYASDPDNHLLVSYKTTETGGDTITGVAIWRRTRANASISYYTTAAIKTVQAYNYLESLVWPNRAAEPSRLEVLQSAGPFVAHQYTGSRAEIWDLSLMGVGPAFQGQGVGSDLVKWGFDRAREEGVGCGVIAAHDKEGFYQKCGFDVVMGRCQDEGGEANPLRELTGGTILFWDNGRDISGVKKYGEA